MSSPRWNKVWRDLTLNRTRTLLALIALAIGTFAVGADLTAYAVLTRELRVNFEGTSPPSVILHVEGDGADRALAQAAAQVPGVAKAEARGLLEARVQSAPDEWKRILLFVIDDFDALQVSTFNPQRGARVPATGELLLERSAVRFLERDVGDSLTLQTPGGRRQSLRITGIVHDAAQSPGWMDGIGYGYLTRDTLALLGEGRALNELRIVVTPGADPGSVGRDVRALVERRGGTVSYVNARQAAQHPHADQMSSLLFLFGAFGALSLVLGALLSASIVATLMRQQVRQIGAMKTIGATSWQITGLYLSAVAALAIAALALSAPLGAVAGLGYAKFVSGVLNFELTSSVIPAWVFAVEVGAGLLVPLGAALLPLRRGSRITVREAMSDFGVAQPADGTVKSFAWLGRSLALSLRNALRSRGRLALTVGILAVGGATFITAFNVSDSWANTVDSLFDARRYDLQVVFSQRYPTEQLRQVLGAVPGVKTLEPWGGAWARVDSARADAYRMMLTAVPPRSEMISYPVLEGRWLREDDTDAIVINHELRQDPEAGLKLGDRVTLTLEGKPSTWTIVGVVRELGVRRRGQNIPASAYVNQRAFEALTGLGGRSSNVVLSATTRTPDALREMTRQVERALDAAGLQRTIVQPSTHRKQELLDHLVIIRDFLLAMAALVAVVGGLALASAMSVNVLERTRELAVMRAVGASTMQVLRIVVGEGLVMAVLSWLLALALSVPLSLRIGDFAGRIFVHANLDNTFSIAAALGWLAVSAVIAVVASAAPARGPVTSPVAEALRYE
jgi:putative ABC transport system permease protein